MELLRKLTQLWAVMTFNFKEGFYHIPLFPRARAHLCVSWRGHLYIRKVASFGVTTTPGVFGNLVDATMAIIENEIPGTKGVNQVDDVFIARTNSLVCNEEQVMNLVAYPGWVAHPLPPPGADPFDKKWKGSRFNRRFSPMGLWWDIDEMTVELPTEKRLKYLAKVQEALKIGFLDLKETEKMVGYLVYVTSIERKMMCSGTFSHSKEASIQSGAPESF